MYILTSEFLGPLELNMNFWELLNLTYLKDLRQPKSGPAARIYWSYSDAKNVC
jgi:hypothetical protein